MDQSIQNKRYCYSVLGTVVLSFLLSACSSIPADRSGRRGLFDSFVSSPERGRGGQSDEDGEDYSLAEKRALSQMSGWRWPLAKVTMTSPFGSRGRSFHEGMDLRASVGTPVYAAQAGSVVYSGSRISGYGQMVVIKHAGSLLSVYAHLSRRYVKVGAQIKRGQRIALAGKTGHATGPHLHFEIRKGVMALNPARLMSGRLTAAPLARAPASKHKSKKRRVQVAGISGHSGKGMGRHHATTAAD